ncbi:MAG: hypothetical protein LBQ78_03115 [Tannerellaceae bacterium]|jgi:lipopolysaccharide export system protein LptA|nr:hypothetical protein [Tannerellaceae bacterium]
MKKTGKFLFIVLFHIIFFCVWAQMQEDIPPKQTVIYLLHADTTSFDEAVNPDIKVLTGNVSFRHDSSFMYCDSAYLYESTNSLEAFGNVRMEQGDTLFLYGDHLLYDGNMQLARMREHVRMENKNVTLFTDSLNYDRSVNVGYYFEGGLIVDEENELSSFYGQYSPDTKQAVFNDSVRLNNPDFTLYSDTLHYQTDSKIATILGPSVIESDSGTIYSSRGWYNTETNVSLLLDRSQVVSGDKTLMGDSILYDKTVGYSEVFGNMFLQDTLQKAILRGEYGFYNELTEYAFATDSACFMEYSEGDTLYLHADTIRMATVDSTSREVKAYYGVRFYRTDLQGVCDSMRYNTRDSVLYMYTDPVVWNGEYQLYGDTILVFLNDSSIQYVHVMEFAFAVQYLNVSCYNQLKGNDMKAYFEQQAVRQIDVGGNVESIYYVIDGGEMVGMNHTKSPYLTIWLKDNQMDKIKMWPASEGTNYPIPDLTPELKLLKDFYWFDYLRPKNKDDIYQVIRRKTEDVPKRGNKFVHS